MGWYSSSHCAAGVWQTSLEESFHSWLASCSACYKILASEPKIQLASSTLFDALTHLLKNRFLKRLHARQAASLLVPTTFTCTASSDEGPYSKYDGNIPIDTLISLFSISHRCLILLVDGSWHQWVLGFIFRPVQENEHSVFHFGFVLHRFFCLFCITVWWRHLLASTCTKMEDKNLGKCRVEVWDLLHAPVYSQP